MSSRPMHRIPIANRPAHGPIASKILFPLLMLCGLIGLAATTFLAAPLLFIPTFSYAIVAYTKDGFGRLLIAIMVLFAPSTVHLTMEPELEGLVERDSKQRITRLNLPPRLVVIANHQAYTDWMYLWIMACYSGNASGVVILLKYSLRKVPILGWGMERFFKFIFMKRNWAEDRGHLTAALERLRSTPTHPLWLMIFPEGTIASDEERPKSVKYAQREGIADFIGMLHPRSTGLLFCLRSLHPHIPDLQLLDVTITYNDVPFGKYPQDYYGIASIFYRSVPPPIVHIHLKLIDLKSVPALTGGEMATPAKAREFELWLRGVWEEKEERLQREQPVGEAVVIRQISIRIDGIRSNDVHVGLREYEINLLRLIEKVTNGSTIEISVTGTSFLFHPGVLPGGSFQHTCHVGRSIGYYLEILVPLGPFCKKPLDIMLNGITGEEGRDMTVDMIRTVTLPHLHLFGISDGLELQIKKRGAAPLGGGQIIFKCPIVRQLNTLQFMERGKIRKIRGIAYSTRVSPQFANRMVEAARSILNRYIPDIYLFTDVYKGEESGKSPGYGLTLVAQSSTSALYSAECLSPSQQTPEDIALHAARCLLEEISKGGCVDSKHQWLVMLLMVLGKEDVGKCRMGPLTSHSVQFLRDVVTFFGTRFKIIPDEEEIVVSCIGVGYSNVNKSVA